MLIQKTYVITYSLYNVGILFVKVAFSKEGEFIFSTFKENSEIFTNSIKLTSSTKISVSENKFFLFSHSHFHIVHIF